VETLNSIVAVSAFVFMAWFAVASTAYNLDLWKLKHPSRANRWKRRKRRAASHSRPTDRPNLSARTST
jgi:hypothetical protein